MLFALLCTFSIAEKSFAMLESVRQRRTENNSQTTMNGLLGLFVGSVLCLCFVVPSNGFVYLEVWDFMLLSGGVFRLGWCVSSLRCIKSHLF